MSDDVVELDSSNETSNLCCATMINTSFLDKETGTNVSVGCLVKVVIEQMTAKISVRSADLDLPAVLAKHLVFMLGPSGIQPEASDPNSVKLRIKGAASSSNLSNLTEMATANSQLRMTCV